MDDDEGDGLGIALIAAAALVGSLVVIVGLGYLLLDVAGW